MDRENQIEEIAKDKQWQRRDNYCLRIQKALQYKGTNDNEDVPSILVDFENEIRKEISEDSVVLSREEYEKYQSFKNGDYCATKCDIHELSFNQMNKISDLENENEKLKNEIKNPNEVLEDRERFRARNEELKGITEQLRQEIITLSQELVNSRKETAEKIWLQAKTIVDKTKHLVQGREYLHIDALKEIAKSCGVDIKEQL